MLHIAAVTLFPEMFKAVTEHGITGRAVTNGLLEVSTYNPRDYAANAHRTVDDRPYGGGPGMVMMVEPLKKAIRAAKKDLGRARVIYMTPQGQKMEQKAVKEMSARQEIILVAGRYEGIDERVITSEIDEEWSIGDYVLSGGELPAMVLIDAMARIIPGVLGHDDSAKEDSFYNGLLDYPHYTRPEKFDDMSVPEVLMGGDHKLIQRWRLKQALGRTWERRPDLLVAIELEDAQQALLNEYIQEQADLKND